MYNGVAVSVVTTTKDFDSYDISPTEVYGRGILYHHYAAGNGLDPTRFAKDRVFPATRELGQGQPTQQEYVRSEVSLNRDALTVASSEPTLSLPARASVGSGLHIGANVSRVRHISLGTSPASSTAVSSDEEDEGTVVGAGRNGDDREDEGTNPPGYELPDLDRDPRAPSPFDLPATLNSTGKYYVVYRGRHQVGIFRTWCVKLVAAGIWKC